MANALSNDIKRDPNDDGNDDDWFAQQNKRMRLGDPGLLSRITCSEEAAAYAYTLYASPYSNEWRAASAGYDKGANDMIEAMRLLDEANAAPEEDWLEVERPEGEIDSDGRCSCCNDDPPTVYAQPQWSPGFLTEETQENPLQEVREKNESLSTENAMLQRDLETLRRSYSMLMAENQNLKSSGQQYSPWYPYPIVSWGSSTTADGDVRVTLSNVTYSDAELARIRKGIKDTFESPENLEHPTATPDVIAGWATVAAADDAQDGAGVYEITRDELLDILRKKEQ